MKCIVCEEPTTPQMSDAPAHRHVICLECTASSILRGHIHHYLGQHMTHVLEDYLNIKENEFLPYFIYDNWNKNQTCPECMEIFAPEFDRTKREHVVSFIRELLENRLHYVMKFVIDYMQDVNEENMRLKNEIEELHMLQYDFYKNLTFID